MDFIDKINELAARIPKQLDYCKTEEATKTALVMPFINALGYDVFNPREVVPEFTADYGTKKGEKVDYAVFQNGEPVMLFECKWSGANLAKVHASQLYRYFTAIHEVRFGVLTNGVEYRFFSDLEAPNRMDDKPFFIFNMLDFQERHVGELKKFTKSTFDLDAILETASELKYTAALHKILAEEFEEPSEDFVVFLARQVYSGRMTQSAKEQFSSLTQKALRRFLNEKINERLQTALEGTTASVSTQPEDPEPEDEDIDLDVDDSVVRVDKARGIVTTEDEIEGLFAVKSILRDLIDAKRVQMRDTKSYCGILLDDNNRKPLCRLHFNREQKYIGLFDQTREDRIPINNVDEIYDFGDRIIATLKKYDPLTTGAPIPVEKISGKVHEGVGNFTGMSLLAVHFKGVRYPVGKWKDALLTVFGLAQKERSEVFARVAPQLVGRTRKYVATSESELVSAARLPGTPYYLEANLSSLSIARLCFNLIEKMGYAEDDLAFETD